MDNTDTFNVMMGDHDGTHHQQNQRHHYHDAASTSTPHGHQRRHHFDYSAINSMETMETMETIAAIKMMPIEPSESIDTTTGLYHDNNDVNIGVNRGETLTERQEEQQQHEEKQKQEGQDEMSIEERQIHESLLRQREEVHAKLQATLVRVHETTKTMLNEIGHFLESTESVMIDYTKCQNSQREEARRLEEVEPDVAGATERYLAQVQGMSMMMQK